MIQYSKELVSQDELQTTMKVPYISKGYIYSAFWLQPLVLVGSYDFITWLTFSVSYSSITTTINLFELIKISINLVITYQTND